MTDIRRGGPSTKQILLIVFGALGGALLVLMLACCGLLYWRARAVSPEVHEAQAAADAYLEELHAGHLQAAYQRMTSAFRTRRSFQDFERQLAQYPALTTYTSLIRGSVQITKTPTTMPVAMASYQAVSPKRSLLFNIVLMKENGRWLVEKISP